MTSLGLRGGATNWVELADTEHLRSFLLLLDISANLAGEPFQDLLREHTRGVESGSFFHQLKKYVFSVLGDGSKALHINHNVPTVWICHRLPPHARQFASPRGDEFALDDQPAATLGFENRDLHHCFCPRLR